MRQAPLHDEPLSFGIEEEYLLLDQVTGRPRYESDAVIAAINADAPRNARFPGSSPRATPNPPVHAEQEFLQSQIECATPICTDAASATAALLDFRRVASSAARDRGFVLASTGSPPAWAQAEVQFSHTNRYDEIEHRIRAVSREQTMCGLHVHVAVPDRDLGVAVLNATRAQLPLFLALSVNAPFWDGRDTGFASWRSVQLSRWPVSSIHPVFRDGADYEHRVQRLLDNGVLIDPGLVTWFARLSDRYPTVEFRVADAQLEANDAVALALIFRAFVRFVVTDPGRRIPELPPELLTGSMWLAARDGMSGTLIDPASGELVAAEDALARLLQLLAPHLDAADDAHTVNAFVHRLQQRGPGAARQRHAFRHDGIRGLLALYARSTTASSQEPAGNARNG
ncbi:carboxylate-amine ligase [Humidisolicoccus flavus]|uniref:carboxylate-amine ligase n=1 Tax=Humidisolicoccus flavus TaxID=3111414 RepID=UPI00324A49A4